MFLTPLYEGHLFVLGEFGPGRLQGGGGFIHDDLDDLLGR